MKKNTSKDTYASAIQALEDLIRQMENGETGIDELREKLKEATALIKTCNTLLRGTEEELKQLTKELEEDDEVI